MESRKTLAENSLMSQSAARKQAPIDSHKPVFAWLKESILARNEQRRSNILTHSGSGLDAHRLRTRGAYLLELRLDTTGFPTTQTVRPVRPVKPVNQSVRPVRPVRPVRCSRQARQARQVQYPGQSGTVARPG